MKDAEKFDLAKSGLTCCPECGKPLEDHPLNVSVRSCYLHGDFQILWVEGALQVRWVALGMAKAYLLVDDDASREAFRKRMKKAQDQTARMEWIALEYAEQKVTFLEAAQLLVELETETFPAEPDEHQRRRARAILDHLLGNSEISRVRET